MSESEDLWEPCFCHTWWGFKMIPTFSSLQSKWKQNRRQSPICHNLEQRPLNATCSTEFLPTSEPLYDQRSRSSSRSLPFKTFQQLIMWGDGSTNGSINNHCQQIGELPLPPFPSCNQRASKKAHCDTSESAAQHPSYSTPAYSQAAGLITARRC